MSIFDFFNKKKKLVGPWCKYYTRDDLNYKIPDISMYEQIKNSATNYPFDIAIKYLGRKINYSSFLEKIDIAAKGFKNLGIRKGDIVTILLPNIPEVLICVYALNKIGAVANMTHPLSASEEIKETIISTNSKYLIIYDASYEKIRNYIKNLNMQKVIFVSPGNSLWKIKGLLYDLSQKHKFLHHPKDSLFLDWPKFFFLARFVQNTSYPKNGRDTPAVILHSGGTSGNPKHVVIQNRAFIFGAKTEATSLHKLRRGDSALAIMPNFHGFGLSVLMHTPLALGYTTILVPNFDAKKFDTLISNQNESNLDLSFLKYVISGGDILPKQLEDKVNLYLQEHHAKTKIIQGYGLSEALACVSIASDDIYKSGSVGIPLAGNYIKIIDAATRKELPYLKIGEIVIASKALMMGYLNNEKETNEALQIHNDGHVWLHTGDLGYMDKDGFLFYQGRIKRMIISSGYNVYPSRIEEVIESHPAVLQCSVVGVPHFYKQEVPKAFIVLKEDLQGMFIKQELDKIAIKNDIKNYCAKKLSKYMIPNDIVIRKSLPKTKLGKVDFQKLKEDTREDE